MHVPSGIAPMLAATVPELPSPGACRGGCRYEPKWDGFRALAHIDEHHGVTLYSRRGTRFNEAFGELVTALYEQLPAATVVDGEIIRWSEEGRLDFEALQRRLIAGRNVRDLMLAEPCHMVLFDVLESEGTGLLDRPLRERRDVLERLLADAAPTARIVLCPQTDDLDEARLWFTTLAAQGIEGIVVKAADEPYRPGERRWSKVKHRATTEAIIGGVTGPITHPEAAILGRYSSEEGGGALRVVARTSPLPPGARDRLAQLLTPAGDDHPWPAVLPSGWASSLFGSEQPTVYTRVVPRLVAEVSVDVAADRGRWRHTARWVRLRPDRDPEDVPTGLDIE